MVSKYDYHKRELGENYFNPRPKKRNKLARTFAFLFFFLFLVALFVYVFPEVEITIVPKTEKIVNDFEVKVDGNIGAPDLTNNKLPAVTIGAEDALEKTFPTTGEKNIGEKAEGTVVFYNQTGLAQTLTTNSSLSADGGRIFYLQNNIEIPKAEVSPEGTIVYGTISAKVVAKEGGEDGNIGPGRIILIDLPFNKQSKIYGEIKENFVGGSNKKIKVVSEDDIKNAEKSLTDELYPKLKEQLLAKIDEGQKIDDKLIKYQILSVEKAVELEEEVAEFTMKARGLAEALTWDETQINDMVSKKLEEKETDGKKVIASSQDVLRIEPKEFDIDKKTAELSVHAENQISMPVEIEKLKDQLKGMSETEARRFLLSHGNIKDVRFKFNYSITNKVPSNGNRIIINLSL
ncbi:hypothetical protein GYA54_01140 [Candidatus Kuenenbacteria bacterium]|nr:hypothetical protein [Candidatus Kuenenbacteria bacterium]